MEQVIDNRWSRTPENPSQAEGQSTARAFPHHNAIVLNTTAIRGRGLSYEARHRKVFAGK